MILWQLSWVRMNSYDSIGDEVNENYLTEWNSLIRLWNMADML